MKKKKENEINKNLHWEEEKRQRWKLFKEKIYEENENEQRELEENNIATVEEVVDGGASKEMGSTVSDEVKNGLVADDPWLQESC